MRERVFSKTLLHFGEACLLRLVKSHYHFRRVVPVAIRDVVGKRELWFSLHTAERFTAKGRASYLYGQTSILFQRALFMTPAEVAQLLKEQAEAYEAILLAERKEAELARAEHLLQRLQDHTRSKSQIDKMVSAYEELSKILDLHAIRVSLRENMLQERIDDLKSIISEIARPTAQPLPSALPEEKPETRPKGIRKAKLPISTVVTKHLEGKKVSSHTIKNAKKTLQLFISCFGDMDVRDINGSTVGDFRDALLSLPTVHGRGRKGLSIQEEIDRVLSEELETIAPKTVKNHFSRISPAWADLVRREVVSRNPWQGWDFDTTQKVIRRAWTEQELTTLITTRWERTAISERTFRGMVTMALYTGMRLGEIANLRNEDIIEKDGILCFVIGPHDDGWKPKTPAGIRVVPVHSELMRFGIMDYMKKGEKYLFSELRGSDVRSRGQTFANEFSKHKTSLGLPLAVTFHGFRHTVSTRLRNVRADIREVWIDALLGHEASHKSMGTLNYLSGIDTENLHKVVENIRYPMEIFTI